MPGIGTIINFFAVTLGGIIGVSFGKHIKEELRAAIITAIGIAVIMLGASGAIEKMFVVESGAIHSEGSLMMILSLVVGTIMGELVGIERGFARFGEWLKKKSGSEGDSGFVDAFLISSFTVCIGAMAIVGSIQDGLFHDPGTLIAKSIIDFFTIMMMASSMGKGCIFSSIPVVILQGSVTLLSGVLEPIMTDMAQNYLSMVGSVLIFCIGLNLAFDRKIRVANMLPSIVIAVAWALIEGGM